jgi:hypothetical protein
MRPGPVMSRSASRQRTEDAYVKHLLGHTWQQIADQLGFRSRQGAQTAVARYLDANPPDTPKAALRAWLDRKRHARAALFRSMAAAEAQGDHQAVAQLSAALDRNDSEVAKVCGFYAAEKLDVNVRQSATAIIDRMESELLALAEAGNNIIEGEVVP